MNISDVSVFQTYVADSPVDVYYYIINVGKFSHIMIKSIHVMPDNRPLYRTRTKELNDDIIALIEEEKKKCTTSLETMSSA